MKDRQTVKHGMLLDLEDYLRRTGWTIEEPKGEYEVLRASKNNDEFGPLLVHNRTSGGCGYSVNENNRRDKNVYRKWKTDRSKRGLDRDYPSTEERIRERDEMKKRGWYIW